MFVRLAFSVAIHADPDILIVDEALAVGDAAFQAKCMARMRQMMDSGLTLLFVSHDIGAVKSLCTRALLLDRGRMIAFGDTERVVDEYTRLLHLSSSAATPPVTDVQDAAVSLSFDDSRFRTLAAIQRMGNGKSTLLNVRLTDALGTDSDAFFYNSAARLQLQVRVNDPVPLLVFGYHVRDRNGVDVLYSDSLIEGKSIENPAPGAIYIIEWRLRLPLRNGQYNVACVISSPREEVTGTTYTCEDLVISDFVAVAAQFSVCGNTILHGFVHLDNEVSVTPWHQEQQKRVAHEGL
jgi:lipopolysaccharide transport system ATP-binding protein